MHFFFKVVPVSQNEVGFFETSEAFMIPLIMNNVILPLTNFYRNSLDNLRDIDFNKLNTETALNFVKKVTTDYAVTPMAQAMVYTQQTILPYSIGT